MNLERMDGHASLFPFDMQGVSGSNLDFCHFHSKFM